LSHFSFTYIKKTNTNMKKFLAVLAIAGTLVACNDGSNSETSTDTTSTTTITTDTNTVISTDTTTLGTGTDTAGTGTGTTDTTTQR
jgi:hypothetical protein